MHCISKNIDALPIALKATLFFLLFLVVSEYAGDSNGDNKDKKIVGGKFLMNIYSLSALLVFLFLTPTNLSSRKPEVAILDYVTQQHKLLPQVATLYSLLFAVDALETKYKKYLEKMRTGDISELPEVSIRVVG